jgi:isocitrate dehydrogenase
VPLLNGGGLYETGAGGSAPKHVQQFLEEGHLRWDSLGEFLALGVSLEDFGRKTDNTKAMVLATALNDAIGKCLDENLSPGRVAHELDNRGSHIYLARYWAEALAMQITNVELKQRFKPLAEKLAENEKIILAEIDATAGQILDIGGYYLPDTVKVNQVMRPSQTFNDILTSFSNQ